MGIDIDPARIEESRQNAVKAGVVDRVTFRNEDLFVADIQEATVVTLFLSRSANLKLRPKLLRELKTGARVVSYYWDMVIGSLTSKLSRTTMRSTFGPSLQTKLLRNGLRALVLGTEPDGSRVIYDCSVERRANSKVIKPKSIARNSSTSGRTPTRGYLRRELLSVD